jgi:hypothetical protein
MTKDLVLNDIKGTFCDGRSFSVEAFTWQQAPNKGLNYNLVVDGVAILRNTDKITVLAFLHEKMRKALEEYESVVQGYAPSDEG